jgi:hypothetical protein
VFSQVIGQYGLVLSTSNDYMLVLCYVRTNWVVVYASPDHSSRLERERLGVPQSNTTSQYSVT